MLTPAGAAWLWRTVTASGEWRLAVTDGGSQRAEAPAEVVSVTETDNGATVVFASEFGTGDANFEWASREVIAPDGTPVDAQDEDQGRKVEGSVWRLEASVELVADPGVY